MKHNFDFSILRHLRKTRGFTISEVAEQSGISTAVISRIERNQASPELSTLSRLAELFQMKGSDLLRLAESNEAQIVTSQYYNSGGFQFQNIKYKNAKCFLAAALAGGKVHRPEVHQNDFEICWVLTGSIELKVGEDEYLLKEGDAIQFDAILSHSYKASQDSKILMIHLPKGVELPLK